MTLRLTQTAKTYPDGTQALLPTDLTVSTGEIVSLLGPSGCGKTTLLRIIAGLETPDAGGEIWFDNDNVTAQAVERRNVGMVFQSYALFPNMSVRQNIGYGLKIQKFSKSKIADRVTGVLEMCQLENMLAEQLQPHLVANVSASLWRERLLRGQGCCCLMNLCRPLTRLCATFYVTNWQFYSVSSRLLPYLSPTIRMRPWRLQIALQ